MADLHVHSRTIQDKCRTARESKGGGTRTVALQKPRMLTHLLRNNGWKRLMGGGRDSVQLTDQVVSPPESPPYDCILLIICTPLYGLPTVTQGDSTTPVNLPNEKKRVRLQGHRSVPPTLCA